MYTSMHIHIYTISMNMKKDEIQEHLSFWRERQASELTPATIFQFKMCCTGQVSWWIKRIQNHNEKAQEQGAITQGPRYVNSHSWCTNRNGWGPCPHGWICAQRCYVLMADNTEGPNMANGTTLFDINMGLLNASISTPSGLFLPDDMHLGGPIKDGIGVGSLQLDDDLFSSWDSGFSLGAQETLTFSPIPMMANLPRGPSHLRGLPEGTLDNPGTANPQAWARQASSAEPHHTDYFMGYSNSSLGQLLEAVPSQGIGNILVAPPSAKVNNELTGPAMTWTERKQFIAKTMNYQVGNTTGL